MTDESGRARGDIISMGASTSEVDWGSVADYVTALVTAISAFLIVVQLRLDHERSRRQIAVDLLRDWTKSQTIGTNVVVSFVGDFNTEQAESLISKQPIILHKDKINEQRIIKCFEIEFSDFTIESLGDDHCSYYEIGGKYAAYLRFHSVNYLNLLESILSAWNSGVARADMLEDQFLFLRKKGGLRKVREAFKDQNGGVEAYPSLSNFLSDTAPRVRRPLTFLAILGRRR